MGTKLLYATPLQVDGGVHPLNVSCKVLGPAGFRYTVGSNGLNNPESISLEGAWYGGSPGDSYINFSKIDSAGYRCRYADANFDTSIVSSAVNNQCALQYGIELDCQDDSIQFNAKVQMEVENCQG